MAVVEKKTSAPKHKKRARSESNGAMTDAGHSDEESKPIWEVAADLSEQIPEADWARWPRDGSINYRQYLYGTPQAEE